MTAFEAWKPDICIYHGNCDDGFAAAWVVWKKWGNDVLFVPAVYGKPLEVDLSNKNLLMVDFSFPYEVMASLSWKTRRIVILDHHKTAQAALQRLPQMPENSPGGMRAAAVDCWSQNIPEWMAYFDMEHSGARLAWDFCFPKEMPRPELIDLVEDRDLWRFKFGDRTKQFSAALRTYHQQFGTWTLIADDIAAIVDEGAIVLRAHRANIEKFMADAFEEEIGGHFVPCVNVPYHYASDAAHELLQSSPSAPFAAAWFKRGDGLTQYSLRSEDGRLDVSEIAKLYGGGGHRNAAGFQVPMSRSGPPK